MVVTVITVFIWGSSFLSKVHPQQVVRLLREILALIGEPGATLAVWMLPANRYHMACTKCVVQTRIVLVVF